MPLDMRMAKLHAWTPVAFLQLNLQHGRQARTEKGKALFLKLRHGLLYMHHHVMLKEPCKACAEALQRCRTR